MKKKKTEKPKLNMPLRRQSFSDFSQSYSGGLSKNKLSYNERMRRRRTLMKVLAVLGFIAVFIIGYLTVSVMLDISKIPPESSPGSIIFELPLPS